MEYIIASTGRSGSTLLANLVSEASGREICYANNLNEHNNYIKKTHCHFKEEPNFDYRGLFIYGDAGDNIDSVYSGKTNLPAHLVHLEVKKEHQRMFWRINKICKFASFAYLIVGDKFRFKENLESWKNSKNTLFIRYEDLCQNKKIVLRKISKHMNLQMPDFVVRKRDSSKKNLPLLLRLLVKIVYDGSLEENR